MKVGLAGKTLSYENQELTLWRSRGPEQVWLNLDFALRVSTLSMQAFSQSPRQLTGDI